MNRTEDIIDTLQVIVEAAIEASGDAARHCSGLAYLPESDDGFVVRVMRNDIRKYAKAFFPSDTVSNRFLEGSLVDFLRSVVRKLVDEAMALEVGGAARMRSAELAFGTRAGADEDGRAAWQ